MRRLRVGKSARLMATETRRKADIEVVDLALTPLRELNQRLHGVADGVAGRGGLLVIHGDAAARCGISMKGIDIVVAGSVGHMSAFMAQTGCLVVCGDAGEALGDSIYEAHLYIAGDVASLGADCVEKELRDGHVVELRALLDRGGLDDVDPAEFRRYGSARRLYNFHVDNAGAY